MCVPSRRSFTEVSACASYDAVVPALALAVTLECANARGGRAGTCMPCFVALEEAAISPQDYLVRLVKYMNCSKTVFTIVAVFIRRLREVGLLLDSFNVHRVLIGCAVVAAKMSDDNFYGMSYYAQVGGLSLRDLREVESGILTLLDFDLYVTGKVFTRVRSMLIEWHKDQVHAGLNEGDAQDRTE
eukprot:TRINITY_DN11748_c0_g1_i1.p1 TRINITY_DN11748_c0_g1~~TRINITY_DN11748_c0_g1_i1.p1  ORF type:complete len:186 (+),score=23.68 TRINITY_DN11748_c0_g1_i1:410-967(+)